MPDVLSQSSHLMVVASDTRKMVSLKPKAIHYCANWNNGDCIGAFFYRKDNILHTKVRKKYANKPCQVDIECSYFNNVVLPGITSGI